MKKKPLNITTRNLLIYLLCVIVFIIGIITIINIIYQNTKISESAPTQNTTVASDDSPSGLFFAGTHQLEAFGPFMDTISKEHFLQIDINANLAHFMWKDNSGSIINSTLPYDKMRFVFISEERTDSMPYVKFRWKKGDFNELVTWKDHVIYYIVGIKKSQIVN